ncbi:hypothetical protein BB560_003733 [Smittium megazygosporum]|uniref:ATP-dependent RNA helicase n=1 Tax=Smittium megazygosporum TaxID=133381 RepID=A0A2T9ZB59_9FUNG|nr:hypothetical protein BB560_003733 [Smittium megazygosporum]
MSFRNKKISKAQKRDLRAQEQKHIQELIEQSKSATFTDSKLFSELPISKKTLAGLSSAKYVETTPIQSEAIPLALANKDVMGAAKTGSGKTLAFIIPVLEKLYKNNWSRMDGLGALILSPTRELALQIFEVLCKIGKKHSFSAGLVIGGKNVSEERERVSKMNILVATPGRLLQHLDQSPDFNMLNLQILVIDEADRILDMGFEKTVNAIIENLPVERQTLLFSATQNKSVKNLARLSLKQPEYVDVYDPEKHVTPQKLNQYYMEVELQAKLDYLFSFIKTHLKTRIIVFMSSCKQVRFVYETFCKLQPGIPLLHLHGKQKQMARSQVFSKFRKMPFACMFCTDIAARGLDFPIVDWVIQLDCPEDTDTYIHRVGRSARYESSGNALLFLLPSELYMVSLLEERKVPITKISPKKSKTVSISNNLQLFCFQDPEIKYLGQKSFISYVRSIYFQKDKKVFDVDSLPLEKYAEALGLPGAPKIKLISKSKKAKPNLVSFEDSRMNSRKSEDNQADLCGKAINDDIDENDQHTASENVSEDEESDDSTAQGSQESDSDDNILVTNDKNQSTKTKISKMINRKNTGVLAEHYLKIVDQTLDETAAVHENDDSDDEFLVPRNKINKNLKNADLEYKNSIENDFSETTDNSGYNNSDFVKVLAVNKDTNMPVVIPNIPASEMNKRQIQKAKQKIIKNMKNQKVIFDEEGNPKSVYDMVNEDAFYKDGDVNTQVEKFTRVTMQKMRKEDLTDKQLAKEKRRLKRIEKKMKDKKVPKEDKFSSVVLETPGFGGQSDGEYTTKPESNSDLSSGSDSEDDGSYSSSEKGNKRRIEISNDSAYSEDEESAESEYEDNQKHLDKRARVSKEPDYISDLQNDEQLALKLLGSL